MTSLPTAPESRPAFEPPLAASAGIADSTRRHADPVAAWLDLMETVELLRASCPPSPASPPCKPGHDYRL